MNIILKHNGKTLESFELPSNPFTKGQKLDLQVLNLDKEVWNVKDYPLTEFIVEKIEHNITIKYEHGRHIIPTLTIRLRKWNTQI